MKDKIFSFASISSLFVLAVFAVYFYSIYADDEELAIVMAAVFNLSISGIIFYQIYRKKCLRASWLLIAGVPLTWGFADIVYMVMQASSMGEDIVLHSFYAVPVVVLFCAFFMLAIHFSKHNNFFQAVADSGVVLIASFSFLVSIFFSENFIVKSASNVRFLYNVIYLFIDALMFLSCMFMILTLKNSRKYMSFFILLFAIVFYSSYDMFYSFGDIAGKDFDNEYEDLGFSLSFFTMMIASFYITDYDIEPKKEDFATSILKKVFVLLAVAVLQIYITQDTNLTYLMFMVILTLFYSMLTFNIISEAQNKKMLEIERKAREDLKKTIKERVKELEFTNHNLNELSKFDYLTKAYNRPHFITLLSEMINTKDLGECINVFTIDLNHFKVVNDTYGHYVGDEVLVKLVENLKEILPKNAAIARFGGDDIVIAIKQKEQANDYIEQANKILRCIRTPISIDANKITLNAKIGVSHTQTSHLRVEDLISQSQAALNVAKESLSSSFVLYNTQINYQSSQQHHIKMLLDSVNFDEEFRLVYQPQYRIEGKQLIGAEALVRWHSKLKGFVSPAVFIPIAEQSPVIVSIGKWVTKNAISKIAQINKKYGTNVQMSINVSPRQIDSINFATNMLDIIAKHDIPAKMVCFEITEMSWMSNEDIMQEILLNFDKNGIDVAIDDFGTGFSSLSYIKKYKITKLKIAKELVDNIENSPRERDVVMAIIALAKNLKIKTIAEGVETEAQLEILRELGCDEVQGYVWGKPLSEDDFEKLVESLSSSGGGVEFYDK